MGGSVWRNSLMNQVEGVYGRDLIVKAHSRHKYLRVIFWVSRIRRQSRQIDFSFISPNHTFGWTYSRKNSLKFQRFILRPKFKKSSKFAYNGGFRGLKCSEFHASLRKQLGRKNNLMKTKLCTNIILFFYFKSCNKFLEVLFVAF